MKKIIAVIPITILFVLLSCNYIVNASTLNDLKNQHTSYVVVRNNNTFYVYWANSWQPDWVLNNNTLNNDSGSYFNKYWDLNFDPIINPDEDLGSFNSGFANVPVGGYDVILGYRSMFTYGTGTYTLYPNEESYIEHYYPPPDLSWYEEMFSEFVGAIEGIASVVTGGFSNLVEAFTEFWVIPVGGDEGDMFFPTDIVIASPTPTPTPMQYQTVIAPTTDPQGNVIYQYKYVYNNPFGTPIITDSPPVNNYGGGDSFDYPYYENPDNKDNPYKLKIPWYLKLIFGNKIVDETTLDDSVNVIQDYMNDDDINHGVTTVYDGMSAIPTDWLILIGVISSIPLFGCLISRLLS